MIQNGSPAYHKTLEDSECAADFPWSPPVTTEGAKPLFSQASPLKSVFHVLRTSILDSRLTTVPWIGQRWLLQCFVGHIGVVVADGPTIAKHGDLSAWLGKAHYDVLKSEVVYCLDPGDSVFLPLGSRPIIVALPTSEECAVAPAPPQKAKKDSKSTPKFTKSDFAVYVATQAIVEGRQPWYDRVINLLSSSKDVMSVAVICNLSTMYLPASVSAWPCLLHKVFSNEWSRTRNS